MTEQNKRPVAKPSDKNAEGADEGGIPGSQVTGEDLMENQESKPSQQGRAVTVSGDAGAGKDAGDNPNADKPTADKEDPWADQDQRYEPKRVSHRKPLKGSQLEETGFGSPVFKPGETGNVVTDDGYELSVSERLALLENGKPGLGRTV